MFFFKKKQCFVPIDPGNRETLMSRLLQWPCGATGLRGTSGCQPLLFPPALLWFSWPQTLLDSLSCKVCLYKFWILSSLPWLCGESSGSMLFLVLGDFMMPGDRGDIAHTSVCTLCVKCFHPHALGRHTLPLLLELIQSLNLAMFRYSLFLF